MKTLIVRDREGELGTVTLDGDKLYGDSPEIGEIVAGFLRRTGSPEAAFQKMAGWSNGYLGFSSPDVDLAAVRPYTRFERGRREAVRGYGRVGGWIPEPKWLLGQQLWKARGRAAQAIDWTQDLLSADIDNRQKLDQVMQMAKRGQGKASLAAARVWHQAKSVRNALNSDPDARLLEFDPADQHVVIAYGDPQTAKNVITYVPGAGTDLDRAEPDAPRSVALRQETERQSGEPAAVVYWLGYHAPRQPLAAIPKHEAIRAGRDLAQFQNRLSTAHKGPGHFTVLGHSYGSTVAGEAAARHGMKPDELVFVGSPGVGVHHVSELGVDSAHVWAGRNPYDPVGKAAGALSADFGGNPVAPRFGAQVFNAIGTQHPELRTRWQRFEGPHNVYWDQGSPSLRNIGAISAGKAPIWTGATEAQARAAEQGTPVPLSGWRLAGGSMLLNAYDRSGWLGTVSMQDGQLKADWAGLTAIVDSFVRRYGSPAAALQAMTGWSNGYIAFEPGDPDINLAAVKSYRRSEHGRVSVVHSYDRTLPDPQHWISPEKWAEGQLTWIRRGEAAYEAKGKEHEFEDQKYHYRVRYDPDGPASAPYQFHWTPGFPPAHVSEKALRGMLISYAPRPEDPEPTPAEVGRGSEEARALQAKVDEAVHADRDPEQPAGGLQAETSVRDLSDGSKVLVKVGEDEPSMDREELAAYVSQAIGAGAPMVARERDRHGALVEDFAPGVVMSRYIDPDQHLTEAEFIMDANRLYERGLWTVGLLDYLISNYDRNPGNVIVRDDEPIPIDQGLAMFDPAALPEKVPVAPFTNEDLLKRQMTPEIFTELQVQLAKVRPEFVRLHHLDWYESMIEQLDKLRPADVALAGAQGPVVEQVKSFQREVRGHLQHVRAHQRRKPTPTGPPQLRDVLDRAIAGKQMPEGWIPEDKWLEGQRIWETRGEEAWDAYGADPLHLQHQERWRLVDPDAAMELGREVEAYDNKTRVIGHIRAVTPSHAVIDSEDTDMRYLISVPDGRVEQVQPLDQMSVDPFTWLARMTKAKVPSQQPDTPRRLRAENEALMKAHGEQPWMHNSSKLHRRLTRDEVDGIKSERKPGEGVDLPQERDPETGEDQANYFGQSADTKIVTFNNGDEWIRKRDLYDEDEVPRELLASRISDILGAGAPEVIEDHGELWELKKDAVTALEWLGGTTADPDDPTSMREIPVHGDPGFMYNTPEGLRIGILDYIMGMADRHYGNWLVGKLADGHEYPIPIDHGNAFRGQNSSSPFANWMILHPQGLRAIPAETWDSWRTSLIATFPQFEASGMEGWWDNMMTRFDELVPYAGGP